MSWDTELDDQLLQDLYAWLDQIPLSRPKKRIEKDFADAGEYCRVSSGIGNARETLVRLSMLVLVAELIKYYFPGWVGGNGLIDYGSNEFLFLGGSS